MKRGLKKLEGETLGEALTQAKPSPVAVCADPLDRKLIAAWNEIEPLMQADIRTALKKPTRLGAVINVRKQEQRNVLTSLGYVVHSSFVTPLAREMIEAVDFNRVGGIEIPTEPKRKRAKGAA